MNKIHDLQTNTLNRKGINKNIKKSLKVIGVVFLILLLLIITALFFPTWTPHIKGNNSISALEQVKINGTNHEIMIRGKIRIIQLLFLYMEDLEVLKYHMPINTKTY